MTSAVIDRLAPVGLITSSAAEIVMRPFFLLLMMAAVGCSREPSNSTPLTRPTPVINIDQKRPVLQSITAELADLLRLARPGEACYVCFRDANAADRTDPPAECLALLQDLGQDVRAWSAGELRLSDGIIVDKTSGKAGVWLSIDFEWLKGEREVVVGLGLRRNGLDGTGFKVRLVKEGDRWVAKETFEGWVS